MENGAQVDDIRQRAGKYQETERSWDKMAERYLDVYARAIAGRAGPVSPP
jgi:hypothetical protein